MKTTIQEMIKTDSGTFELGNDMAADLGLTNASPAEVLCCLDDASPGEWSKAVGEYQGWGIVLQDAEGRLYSVEGDEAPSESEAQEFRNRFDDLDILAAELDKADEESGDVNKDQDWDKGETIWVFSDNSEIVIDSCEAIVRQHFGETELTDALNAATALSGLKTVLEAAEDKMNLHDISQVLNGLDVIDLGTIDGPELDDIYEGSLIAHDNCFALTAEAGHRYAISVRAESMPWLIKQVVSLAGNQTAAAELLGVEQASISNYINGKSEPVKSVIFLAQRILAD